MFRYLLRRPGSSFVLYFLLSFFLFTLQSCHRQSNYDNLSYLLPLRATQIGRNRGICNVLLKTTEINYLIRSFPSRACVYVLIGFSWGVYHQSFVSHSLLFCSTIVQCCRFLHTSTLLLSFVFSLSIWLLIRLMIVVLNQLLLCVNVQHSFVWHLTYFVQI